MNVLKDAFSKICNPENIYHAWKKAKRIYDRESDYVFNRIDVSEFEADLQNRIDKLSTKLNDLSYTLTPMIPMDLPKESENGTESRQHFHICLEDQVAWIAVINVIGPILDAAMPYWSFGNRLYMPIWKEDVGPDEKEEGIHKQQKKVTRFGKYRTSSPKLYRNWSSSWPLFHKAVSITAKVMVNESSLSDDDKGDREDNAEAPDDMRIRTWENNYWPKQSTDNLNVYYATIDLHKFYPSIDSEALLNDTVLEFIGVQTSSKEADKLYLLLKRLLSFEISPPPYTDEPTKVNGDRAGSRFLGIPTGLFVAGFLANIAMFEIDQELSNIIDKKRDIAHFRFVDDHVVLAYSVEELSVWIKNYVKIISKFLNRAKINDQKIEPEEFRYYYTSPNDESEVKAEQKCRLDPNIATPFSTLTLKKLSGLSRNPFELLDESEKHELLLDIEHILVTDFPEEEIRKDTRVSWAATLLSRLVPEIDFNSSEIIRQSKFVESTCNEVEEAREGIKESSLEEELLKAKSKLLRLEEEVFQKHYNLYRKVFTLLLKALNDNIAKPKVWKKCVNYCKTTGYDGVLELLKQLDKTLNLTAAGKKYLYATVLSEIASCLLECICIVKSDRYSTSEKDKAKSFTENISKHRNEITARSDAYSTFYSESILDQFEMALDFYEIEVNCKEAAVFKKKDDYAGFLWYATERVVAVFPESPPKMLDSQYSAEKHSHSNDVIARKLVSMYNYDANCTQEQDCDIRHESCTTLVDWISGNRSAISPIVDVNVVKDFDLLSAEWTSLEIIRKVTECVKAEIFPGHEFSFDYPTNDIFKFINCTPKNFKIDFEFGEPIEKGRDIGWHDFREYITERVKISINASVNDTRYDVSYFDKYGKKNIEKRQVYSLATLLVTLLSGNLSFSPIFNRRNPIDRAYKYILEKSNSLNISSYTRSIIIGALSYREFERNILSFFDDVILNRYDNDENDPIKIESINEFESCVIEAQRILKFYQLSLENQSPRQLIPISLVNLSRTYNPYDGEGEPVVQI